jgi:nucleotide-binding universal stress UspA family protein
MYKHLLIATDGSQLAQKAVAQGFALAKAVNAKVTIVTVSEPWAPAAPAEVAIVYPVEDYERAAAANASKILADASAAGAKLQITCDTVHVKEEFPAEGIVETARARGCDLIVMSSHGHRGLMRLVLGSQAHRVVTQSTTSVLICR